MKEKTKEFFRFNFTGHRLRRHIKNYSLVLLGNLILAIGTSIFLLPGNIITGGLSGIGIIIQQTTSFPAEHTITIATWLCFIIGFVFLGKDFTVKTLVSTITYPLFIYLITYINDTFTIFAFNPIIDANAQPIVIDYALMILGALFGGLFVGTGCALTYIGGGSTGGVDVFTIMGQKYFKIKASHVSFFIDASIVIIGFAVFKKMELALIGIIAAFVCALMIDKLFLGHSAKYIAYIVSNNYQAINNDIIVKMERGTTLILSEGGFSGKEIKMIKVAFDRTEYDKIQQIVVDNDPQAFVTIMQVSEINGSGFDELPNRNNKRFQFKNKNKEKNKEE